jgi:hypothetical protein
VLLKRRLSAPLEFPNENEGDTAALPEHSENIEKPLCEKNSPACSTECCASNHSIRNAASTFEYLIGQQRSQSMSHCVAKSRANSNLTQPRKLKSGGA